MTVFVKIENGVVVQKQPNAESGFIEAPDEVTCGYTYESGIFSDPGISDDAKWVSLRMQRTYLLTRSDWTQLPDAPCDQEAWAAYRQELRDLPQTYTDPKTVVWPTQPE